MSNEIHQLDDRTIERIGAGEVVERPASVVKELLENSLDAGASRVTVAVEAGGTERIRVSDDGHGMAEADAKRAVEQHTTSKISSISDLETGVHTLGFRGEALHAIGAVGRLQITTKPRGGSRGTEIRIEGGERTHAGPAGAPEGTAVEVTDLFYNVPARRKYLKQESTEFDHIQRIVTGYALANPAVSITLEHDGRERFSTGGRGDLQETIMAVYGREVASAMIDVGGVELPDGPLTAVEGLVSHPETNRASRSYCSTFVNGRYITSRTVREAVIEAYGSQLGPDRYPFAVVSVVLDPQSVDVNVHPRKLEVRFADDRGVNEQVSHAVEAALMDAGLLRSSAPRGRSAPEQTEIEPNSNSTQQTDETEETPADNGRSTVASSDTDQSDTTDTDRSATRSQRSEPRSDITQTEDAPSPEGGPPVDQKVDSETGVERTATTSDTTGENSATAVGGGRSGRVRGPTTQSRLTDGEPIEQSSFEPEQLPSLRVLGQAHDTYLLTETESGLVLIDQHAADERINYERLQQEFADETAVQALAEPVQLELTKREAGLFEEYVDALAQLGFHASLLDEQRVAEVRTVPALLADAAGPALVRDLLTAFVSGEGPQTIEAAADELLADLACYPSLTGNTSLTEGSIVALLRALDACENPYACPHGRPVLIEISHNELEERFERDYPGHS